MFHDVFVGVMILRSVYIGGDCSFSLGDLSCDVDADPVHHALLKYLFHRSCEPYCGFIKNWIYSARINDPYNEFIVERMNDLPPYPQGGVGLPIEMSLPSIKERDEVSLPCFLKDFCLPLFRAGQQLQVLIKLLKLCNCVRPGDQTYENILPCWSGSSSNHLSNVSPLTFSKRTIEEVVFKRESMYQKMQENLQVFLTRLDIRYQHLRDNVMPFGILSTSVERLISTSSAADKGDSNSEDGYHDSDASTAIKEISSERDLESSECSSSYSSEERDQSAGSHQDFNDSEIRYIPASRIFRNNFNENVQNPSQSENSDGPACDCRKAIERRVPISHYVDINHNKSKSSYISQPFQSGDIPLSKLPEDVFADYQSVNYWPLGGLLKNPFYVDEGNTAVTKLYLTDCISKMPCKNNKIQKEETSCIRKEFVPDIPTIATGKCDTQFENGTDASLWNHKYSSNFFNLNPMLTKNTIFHMMGKSRGTSVPLFDFSSVKDPSKVYGEKLLASPDNVFEFGLPLFTNSAVSDAEGVDECFQEQGYDGNDIPTDQKNSSSTNSENLEENFVASALGGDKWEESLSYLGKNAICNSRARRQNTGAAFDVPLDVVIDKCILQEILLQYNYVSNFTIKLLEEGFDLQEHLLALRRYHFMEFADWADLFIMSLWRHRWHGSEANQKISEIQRFLDLAVQRSSCEGDPYKERLFVYVKDRDMTPFSSSASGVHAFDSIALGYRVDWPVNIVLTPGALKIYADIFSFLIQVKLAVFSLTDIWCSLKDFMDLLGRNHNSLLDDQEKNHFDILIKMRHQVNHFVSTLQQYVQSQLSHVSWSRFLHSLKHKVKDMLDIDSVHMAYLADSLDICFLSDETRPIADIIETILQCALDFGSCLRGVGWKLGFERRDSLRLLAGINFSQVFAIRGTFEKSVKKLYLCYLKSPKHEEFGLCRFWEYLNYNDYYLNAIGMGTSLYAI
ncbi:hypothetical protein GIB67_034202 [Kingdonia uniflora]|uniref:Gamma-tubulin complex component n=1 Tax=Kingdonia uniflora TaxID=39325 RepID=A0A7J7NRY6_9MAGN|nr:hypothetical protein GIB67_034202 [Kingdonia uniflora]